MARRLVLVAVIGLLALSFAVPTQAAPLHQQSLTADLFSSVRGGRLARRGSGRDRRDRRHGHQGEPRGRPGHRALVEPAVPDEVAGAPALYGAVPADIPLGKVDGKRKDAIEWEGASTAVATAAEEPPAIREPLFEHQWGMRHDRRGAGRLLGRPAG